MMVMKKTKSLVLAMCLAVLFFAGGSLRSSERVSEPFNYRGYSEIQYSGIKKFSAYVPMSDGVKLAVDVYLPTGGPKSSFPVIIEYTPYSRANIDLNNGPVHKLARKTAVKTTSPVLDMLTVKTPMGDQLKTAIAHGYVFVRADMRGSGASYGWKADFMPQLGLDGAELVNWIAKQPWCDGNVGMLGGSYSAHTQWVTAQHAGPALKAIVPVVCAFEGFSGEVYPGGIYQQEFMSSYSQDLGKMNLNYYDFKISEVLMGRQMRLPAAPVVDEDGDGDLVDEVPLDLNHNGTFLDDYGYPENPDDPPRYSDGKPRQHIYYMATRDHRQNFNYHFWAQTLLYIDAKLPHPFSDYSAYDFSPSAAVPEIMKKKIAIYDIGGWHDLFGRGTTEYFCTMQGANPSKMMMSPANHLSGGPFWDLYLKNSFYELIGPELLRFFDHYLKGIDNGIDREPPVLIYVMNGQGWRFEKEWPLKRQLLTEFYLGPDHTISKQRGASGQDRYKADYAHDSRYGKTQSNRYLAGIGRPLTVLPKRDEKDKHCLVYTSAPLESDLEVTGHPIVELHVSSSADDGDFFAYLEDVDEHGQALLVTEGGLQAGFAKLFDNDKEIMDGAFRINVLPELPWHGYRRSDFADAVFKGGKIITLTFDLFPTAWVFKKGHAIRVSIAASDWPTFRLNPSLAPGNDPHNPANIVPTITMFRGDAHPSHITLPVIPGP